MTEHGEGRSESQASAADSGGSLAGERLARARREKQISIDEIAKELHIYYYKVRALERNDFEVLGAPVFAKATCASTRSSSACPSGTCWPTITR